MEPEPGQGLLGEWGKGKGSNLFRFSFYSFLRNASQQGNFSHRKLRFQNAAPISVATSVYLRPLFSLWNFHFSSKCLALLNILTVSTYHFVARSKRSSSKWFLSFSDNLGTKIKLTFPENKRCCGTQGHLLWNKNLCLLRAQFLLRNKHGRPSAKEEQPPVDTFSPWWMMLSWQSRFRNGNRGTNGSVLFIKIPFKREKKSQNPKDCIWNQQNLAVLICSLGSKKKKKKNQFALCPHCCDIRVLEVLEAILTSVACYWEVHTGGWVCSLFSK